MLVIDVGESLEFDVSVTTSLYWHESELSKIMLFASTALDEDVLKNAVAD